MDDCPNCEYHKDRAARWRAEAYAQAGHDSIERPWVGLTDEEIKPCWYEACQTDLELTSQLVVYFAKAIETKLKEKNT